MKETGEAYDLIKTKVDKFVDDVDLITVDLFELEGKNTLDIITSMLLQDLGESDMRSITDIIEFNKEHADKELPPRM